ncbi:choline dehydrogenase [Neptunicoccus cionae]|uniref:choline dehydrogenase n=1 Tax=Neptunicoccus cionae TaxID=2035344 RepID=UPI000C793448|nr:choline dehydrogenase [Amylibacter cionae]PLS21080.1 choline dehydrogenase [Amylibacter cionae]
MTTQSWDYVIVGGGSAGCVLASRLTEDRDTRVLLLEAGPEDRSIWLRMPAGMSRVVWGTQYSWAFTSEPEPHLNGRRLGHPRGKVLGGSSSINGMVWLRGNPRDYDGWAQRGATGWSYEDVLPYFRRAETAPDTSDPLRGDDGPIRVTRPSLDATPLARAFVDAGGEAGYPILPDFNGAEQEGFGPIERSTYGGKRFSASRAYLKPARARENLTVVTGALAQNIILEQGRARGIRYVAKNKTVEVRAEREVILAAGAIGSPHLLHLSGIGPASVLENAGIPVRHELSGVGENLNDHPDLVIQHKCLEPVSIYPVTRPGRSWLAGAEWALRGTGPAATNHFEAGGFVKSRPDVEHPDLQFTFMPLSVIPGTVDIRQEHSFQVHIDLMRPKSRGHVRARSADARQAPEILFNYLADPADRADLRNSLSILREVLAQPALSRFAGPELFPGSKVRTDAEIDSWITDTLETCYHPVGTCKMGNADAVDVVVDPECRVRGVDGLRVVDASIMPEIVSANTNATAIMIAEKAADIIRGRGNCAPTW